MKDVKLILELTTKMLRLAEEEFSNHGCNDLEEEIYKLIPQEWCDEARQMNSNGLDPWPEKPSQFTDTGLMWYLRKKLNEISTSLDRDIKISNTLDKIETIDSHYIKSEYQRCMEKADEYQREYEANTGGQGDYWRGKSDNYKYQATRLKRILYFHGIDLN